MKTRDNTLQEEWTKLGRAWRHLAEEAAKALGIKRLLDWLTKKKVKAFHTKRRRNNVQYVICKYEDK